MTALTGGFVRDLAAGLLDLLYPPQCILCQKMGEEALCSACQKSLIVAVPTPYCLRCGQVQTTRECSKCLDFPPQLVRCRSVGILEGDLAHLVHKLKYRDRPMLAKPLAGLMADYLTVRAEIMNDLKFDAVVPVPLHRSRQRRRGYNQSERLARHLALNLHTQLDSKMLLRIRPTPSQVGKHRKERLTNLVGAFKASSASCNGKTILLVDDVATTGSTISECARTLLSAGADSIYAITLAAG